MASVNCAAKPGKVEKVQVRLPPPQRVSVSKSAESHSESTKPKEPKFVPFEPYKAAVSPLFFPESSSETELPISNNDISPKTSLGEVTKITKQHDKVALVLPNILLKAEDENLNKMSKNVENCADKNRISHLEEEIRQLKDEKSCLEVQLHNQIKINSELKKLLVASVGEDLECKVQFLTEDKVKLAHDINHYVQRLLADHEELEKLSIQCDVWRSKFLASSLIVDELAKWKAKLYHRYDETLEALHLLLEEHQYLKENLCFTYGYLQSLHNNFNRTPAHSNLKHTSPKTILDLSVCMKTLSSSLHLRLLGSSSLNCEDTKKVPEEMTTGEQKAELMLTNPGLCHLPADSCGHESCSRQKNQHSSIIVHRFHPNTRYEHLTMNCCAQCRGDIQLL